MSIFICHRHLLDDLLDIFISSFYNAIHLWSVGRRVMMLDFELRAELSDHSVVEIGTIVCNDPAFLVVSPKTKAI